MYKIKNSKVHGKGVYATQNIKKGVKIIEYIGEKISRKEGDRRSEARIKKYLNSNDKGSVYIFQLNNKQDIDGSPLYNKARYINHSCDPNCEVDVEKDKIWISSLRTIKKGEELSYDYGYSFDKEDYKDHPCKCASKHCIGYIISSDEWGKFLKYLKKNMTLLKKS